MSRIAEALGNIVLAARVARFDGTAIPAFKDDDRTFWRSFAALPIVLFLDLAVSGAVGAAFEGVGVEADRSPLASGWLAAGWLLALVIAAEFAARIGSADDWPRFVVAHNWAALIQAVVFAAGVLVISALEVEGGAFNFWIVVVGFWSLVFDWFIVKTALKTTGGLAALLMAILLFAALFMNNLAAGLSGAGA